MNILFGFRTLDADADRAQALVENVKIYSYADRRNPPPTGLLSPDGRPWSGDQPRGGMHYWNCCTTSTNAKSSTNATGSTSRCSPRSASRRARPSTPDERLTRILTAAAADGELMAQANTFAKRFPGSAYWPDRRWDLVLAVDDSSQRAANYDQLLERASWFYEAFSFSSAMKSQTPGVGAGVLELLHRP